MQHTYTNRDCFKNLSQHGIILIQLIRTACLVFKSSQLEKNTVMVLERKAKSTCAKTVAMLTTVY